MINREDLMKMLEHLEPWRYDAGDWRKVATGAPLVRFVDWKGMASKVR